MRSALALGLAASTTIWQCDAFATSALRTRGLHSTATGRRGERVPSSALSLKHLDDDNMVDLLFRPEDGKPVLVDCYTTWCG